MINKISIKNFKSLKKVQVETKSLNLLMGLNGMGKSSFIQALLLLMQSDKLEERVIDLNGLLAQIGKGRDALYQFAEEQPEHIDFTLTFDECPAFSWKFNYQSEKEELIAECGYKKEDMKFFRTQTKKFQYISAERIGPRDIYKASSVVVADKKQLGLLGEYAACYIDVYGSKHIVSETLRHAGASSNKLIAQVNAWMQEISPGVSINTKYEPVANNVILDYQFEVGNQRTNPFRPKNVGFGISYVLPIVLALLTAEEGKIIVIENPESHIHPRGQAELGKLIALAASLGAQLFIETHSDHILNGIRVAVKEGLIDKSKVNVMY
ncbi:MAG: AAA family ATPase, partial [Tannerella sp.]|nr:AAA family ATPase [Tannerella sp.]